MNRHYYVYILTNATRSVLYVGVTNNLIRRVYQHSTHTVTGFTDKFKVDRLVYFEEHGEIEQAIAREKLIKRWRRDWKLDLIRTINPDMKDLYLEIM